MAKSPLLLLLSVILIACNPTTAAAPDPAGHRIVAVPLATVMAHAATELPTQAAVVDTETRSESAASGSALGALVLPERLAAPSIGLDAAVAATDWTPGGEWNVPDGAAGWLQNSSGLGAPGNTVLAGHNNTRGEVFRRLSDLHSGDVITLFGAGQTRAYQVRERLVLPARGLLPEQQLQYASFINRTTDERLTLVTCWPYATNSHRLVIIAMPVES